MPKLNAELISRPITMLVSTQHRSVCRVIDSFGREFPYGAAAVILKGS